MISRPNRREESVMATKKQTLEDPNSCLNKAADDEEIFVLRGQDASAPRTIAWWIMANIESAPPAKLKEALGCAVRMRKHGGRRAAD